MSGQPSAGTVEKILERRKFEDNSSHAYEDSYNWGGDDLTLNKELQKSGHLSGSEEDIDHSRPGDHATPI